MSITKCHSSVKLKEKKKKGSLLSIVNKLELGAVSSSGFSARDLALFSKHL